QHRRTGRARLRPSRFPIALTTSEPPHQRPPREGRRHPSPIDPEYLLVDPPRRPAPRQPVRQWCQRPTDPPQLGDVPEGDIPQRQAMLAMILMEELGLEPGHVHVGRALALAGLALEAEVERLADVRVGEPREAELSGDGEPQQVGAAAGTILL